LETKTKKFLKLVTHLSMKEGSLLCFVLWLWDPPNWETSDRVLEYWMISSLKIKLNRSWKFQGNWNVPLVLLERSWWAGFNGIYLDSECGRYLIFMRFLPLKIHINSKKPGFERKNQLRTCLHLNVYHSIQVEGIVICLWCCWKDLATRYKYTLQNNVICCAHPTLYRVHTWVNRTGHTS
jgi:hypothetical protein